MAWTELDGWLTDRFLFTDFAEAFAFLTRIALVAQEQQHHPDLTISWNRVDVRMTTHDAGSTVTDRDRRLAAAIDEMVGR
jgi:4a-hydroxytetrahydrobiopterin dehydratase